MLDLERREDIARLRTALEQAGYLRPQAAEALGLPLGSEPRRIDLPLFLRRLASPSPLHTLIKLFALRVPVAPPEAATALDPLDLRTATALGIVEIREGNVLPLVGFATTEGLALVHDMPLASAEGLRPDHVVGLNPPALLLAHLAVRRPCGRALDVGCGGGVQSLLAARHCEHVVGVDLNPRALAFARFNARLNEVSNVEFRQGSLYEPVGGERFDLVVCNPPYVVSPESEVLFRDGGRPGDAFCQEVVRGAARHLRPGGFATVIVNWVEREGAHWSEPLREWVKDEGCDAWLLHMDTSDVLTYAAGWNRQPDADRYAAALDRWMGYYARNGIGSIGMGAVVLRRSAFRAPWVEAVELPARPQAQASSEILRAFETRDRVGELGEGSALLAARFRVSEQARVAQFGSLRDGRFEPDGARLRLAGALAFEGMADAGTLQLLQLADGRRSLGEIRAAMSDGRNADAGGRADAILATARRLLALGFLVPAESAGGRGKDASLDGVEPAADAAPARAAGDRGTAGAFGGEAGLGAG